MTIIPAIDIKNGKCVRLTQGKFDAVTIYSDDPVIMAKKWENEGVKMIHIVDLDGAEKSLPVNYEAILRIRKAVKILIQVGGGICSEKTAVEFLKMGIDRIILGTIAIDDPLLLKKLLNKFSSKIIVSLDAKNGKLMKKGWLDKTQINAIDKGLELEKEGVKRIIFTDVTKDGTLTVPNFKIIKLFLSKIKVPLIAAGGISAIESLEKLNSLGVEGVIIGKALYEGKINLPECLKLFH